VTDCPNAEIRDLLPDLLHNNLSAHDTDRAEAHLAACAECRDELELLSIVCALNLVPKSTRPAFTVAVAPAHKRWSALPPLVRLAAGIALVAIGGASYSIASNGVRQDTPAGLESTYFGFLDSASPYRLSAPSTYTASHNGSGLDEQAIMEILAEIEKMDGLLSIEPRPLVRNPKIAGDL
jgi:hypothetical protein